MREILFRGKRKEHDFYGLGGKWVYGIPIQTHIGTFICFEENPHYCGQYGYMEIEKLSKIIPETLGEYTGLTDRNGKRIFEGDILKIKYTPKSVVAVVKYDEFCAGFVAVVSEYLTLGFGADFDNNSCEIIGNVYDDPELLSTASLPEAEDISQLVLQPATPENFELMPM